MAGSSEGSDPLANTELAPGAAVSTQTSGTPPAATTAGPPKTIGRYRIDGVLGQGAMGTVYAAHDGDLERRVALKVLRGAGSEAARARLLREARAMARLSHPAVVTVHEVGTAGGVDYVAMELIDGVTVAEWMRGTPPPPRQDVLEVFVTAGRGLAAAHAAGLIHRDFKPHNVLRSKRGRVVVTDFGLARAQLEEDPEPAPGSGTGTGTGTGTGSGSMSSTLTATGTLLGTPAYMAPEQHERAGAAGPAADQFAFCVAVWEGLAGARPFAGESLGELRAAITRGPDPATEARLPRRVRRALRRGLSVDPARRWPGMDALLAAIAPRRRGGAMVAAGVAAVTAAFVATVAGGRDDARPVAAGCRAPAVELAPYRTGPAHAALAAAGPDAARNLAALDHRAGEWATVQPKVCAAPDDATRTARVTCLTAVRVELEVALAAAARIPAELATHDAIAVVGDPSACTATPPPQRAVPVADEELIELTRVEISDDGPGVGPPESPDPCRLARWQLVMFDNPLGTLAGFPDDLGEGCRDDHTLARIAVARAERGALTLFGTNPQLGPAERAVARAGGDRYLGARLAAAVPAQVVGADLDEAIVAADTQIALFDAAGAIAAAHEARNNLVPDLLRRARPGDAERAEQIARAVLAAVPAEETRRRRDAVFLVARTLWARGAVAEAHAFAAEPVPRAGVGTMAITGRVVDAAGRPVAGASVAADFDLEADAVGLDAGLDGDSATAVSGADGRFTLTDVAPGAVVVAEHGELRSKPVAATDGVDVVLGPTGSVTGRVQRAPDGGTVELRLTPVEHLPPRDHTMDYFRTGPVHLAPIAADGSFTFRRVPHGRYVLSALTPLLSRARFAETSVEVGPSTPPVALSVVPTGLPISVVVRSKVVGGFSGGMVFVLRGTVKPPPRTFGELGGGDFEMPYKFTVGFASTMITAFARAPAPEKAAATGAVEGDIVAEVEAVEPGAITVCALAVAGDILDLALIRTLKDHLHELELGCKYATVAARGQVITVEAPAMKRFP